MLEIESRAHLFPELSVAGKERREASLTEAGEASLSVPLRARLAVLYGPTAKKLTADRLAEWYPASVIAPAVVPEEARRKTILTVTEELRKTTEYPELPRLEQCVRASYDAFAQDLFARMEERRGEISAAFFGGRDFGCVTRVEGCGLAARSGGRMTMRLETALGAFYYKPRSHEPEAFYNQLITRFLPELAQTPPLVCGDGYAFMGAAEPSPLCVEKELDDYFDNLGVFAAAAFALGGWGLHRRNFIPCGARPVPIDLETLADTLPGGAGERVAATGVLYHLDGMSSNQTPSIREPGEIGEGDAYYPLLNGRPRDASGHEESFCAGFARAYRAIMSRRDAWIAALGEYGGMPLRALLRPTDAYSTMMKALCRPELLRAREAREAFLERLWKPLDAKRHDLYRSLERDDLLVGEFPDYNVRFAETNLRDNGGAIRARDWLDVSPLKRAEERLKRMSEDRLAAALREIRDNLRKDSPCERCH